ncbi:MAG TPA: hypothetical protein VMS22_16270 [Candidatus Eisenbacteria bacterium]|nr:hypothetical protein [Candidatus Eisenbacteria bacterium]
MATTAGYGAVVAWLTWPLASSLATHLPDTWIACHFDSLLAARALAWQSHALATAPATLLDANIYHPAHHALLYSAASFGALPYFAPVFALSDNPTLAINATLLGASSFLAVRWVLWEYPRTAGLRHARRVIFDSSGFPSSSSSHTMTPIISVAPPDDRLLARRG